MKKINSRILCVTIAAVLGSAGVAGAFVLSGGVYDIESSVVDNGGGQPLSGGEYSSRGAIAQTSMPADGGATSGGIFTNRTGFYNPPHFVFQEGLPTNLTLPGGGSLVLPPYAVDKWRFDIDMNRNVDPAKISEASDKMVNNDGAWGQLSSDNMGELTIFDEQDTYSKPLAKQGILTMAYNDADNDGIIDGSNPPVRVETLNAWVLDETLNSWVLVNGAGVDTVSKTISVYFGKPGVYAMFGALSTSVDNIFVYPVPFRPYGPQAGLGKGQTGMEGTCHGCGINFASLPQNGHIEIYTPDGRLVKKLVIDGSSTSGLQWDVKTASGERAASGVYIWRVVSNGKSKMGKLMVIW